MIANRRRCVGGHWRGRGGCSGRGTVVAVGEAEDDVLARRGKRQRAAGGELLEREDGRDPDPVAAGDPQDVAEDRRPSRTTWAMRSSVVLVQACAQSAPPTGTREPGARPPLGERQ